jgi:hypothetical protein
MDSPGKKSEPAPEKYPDGDQQRQPAPKTREEAGQLAVDARYHELEKLTDPKLREKTENAIRSHAEKTFGITDKAVEKLRATQARWEQKLNSLNDKSPLKAAAAPVLRAVQKRQRAKIVGTVLKNARKDAAIITRAQNNSKTFRQRAAQSKPGKDLDRER